MAQSWVMSTLTDKGDHAWDGQFLRLRFADDFFSPCSAAPLPTGSTLRMILVWFQIVQIALAVVIGLLILQERIRSGISSRSQDC